MDRVQSKLPIDYKKEKLYSSKLNYHVGTSAYYRIAYTYSPNSNNHPTSNGLPLGLHVETKDTNKRQTD